MASKKAPKGGASKKATPVAPKPISAPKTPTSASKALIEAAPTYLAQADIFRELRADRKRRMLEIDRKFHEDTNDELSDVDYYNLATLQMVIEDIDRNIERLGGVEMVDPALITDQRKAKETVIGILQKWRESKKGGSSTLGSLQEAIMRMRGPGGSMFTVEVRREGEVLDLGAAQVIDVPAVEEVSADGDDPELAA